MILCCVVNQMHDLTFCINGGQLSTHGNQQIRVYK